jgi:hypothetical protein
VGRQAAAGVRPDVRALATPFINFIIFGACENTRTKILNKFYINYFLFLGHESHICGVLLTCIYIYN